MDNELAAREAATGSPAAEGPSSAAEAGPARKKRRRVVRIVPARPMPPIEVCGKWVAWSRRQIVASGETLAEVRQKVESQKIKGAAYELIPPANVRF